MLLSFINTSSHPYDFKNSLPLAILKKSNK